MIPKGKTHNAVAIATGASNNVDLDVSNADRVSFLVRLAGTTTPADLTFEVRAYDSEGVLFDQALPTEATVAAAAVGADVRAQFFYVMRGIDTVQVRVKNNNAASKNADVAYFEEDDRS